MLFLTARMRLVIGNIVASYERIKIIGNSMPAQADVLRRAWQKL